MDFRIADTFTDSLARLSGEEQKAAKTSAFDLQLNMANPGLRLHKLDKAKDKCFWSARVNSDLRMIVHRSDSGLLLCFVGHHDKAYEWAARRKLETHPKTGAAQLVEVRETVREIVVPVFVAAPRQPAPTQPDIAPARAPTAPAKPSAKASALPFAGKSDDELLSYGVPPEWLSAVREATEDSLLVLAEHLPAEAAEALIELATGGKPRMQAAPAGAVAANPMDHPDAQRRFRVMTNLEELQSALEFPWEKWAVFLHPEQRQWVEREYSGPARVSGSAGTGKTIVAVHRAAHLARQHPEARVLLTTFSDTLARALHTKLRRLLGHEPRLADRIDVQAMDAVGLRLHKAHVGRASIVGREVLRELIAAAAKTVEGHKFGTHFLMAEWEQVVDAWSLTNWESYRDVARLGRKTRLPETQRKVLWAILEQVLVGLKARNLLTHAQVFAALAIPISVAKQPVYDFVVVDEAQDISIAQLRFLAALGGSRPNALFFAGDLGQRIFQQSFSWKANGVDIRGRSRTLRVNYRTSHHIRTQADRLLGPAVTDVDGNEEIRSDSVSVFNGPPATIQVCPTEQEECAAVAQWIVAATQSGVLPHELGVFVRSGAQLPRAQAAVTAAGLAFKVLDEQVETTHSFVSISTMHLAKGLEFRAVVVMACDDEVVPLQTRIAAVGDEADLQEVYDTERHLLYVACTRARDQLLVTSIAPASEFIDDLRG